MDGYGCRANNSKHKIHGNVIINILFLALMSLKAISPYYSRNMSSPVFFLFFAGWLFSACWINKWKIKIMFSSIITSSVVLLLWQVLMRLIGISSFGWGNYWFRIVLYGFPAMSFFIIKMYTYREKLFLAAVLLCVSISNIIDNIILWNTSRNSFVGLYYDSYVENRLTNAGTTEFNAFCMFLIPSLFLIALFAEKRIVKVIGMILLLLDIYTIIFVNPHAIALLLSALLFVLLVCVYVGAKNRKRMYLTIGVSLVLMPLIYMLLPSILRTCAALIPKEEIGSKINQVASILSGANIDESIGSSLGSRWQMALVSIESFKENSIFGIGEHNVGQSLNDFRNVGFGGHSELLDYLAKYGILGTIFLVIALYTWIKSVLFQASSNRILRYISHVVWVMFIAYSFLNKSFKLELFFSVFVIYPMVMNLILENRITERDGNKQS